MSVNYYEILEVEVTATTEEIKKAYRKKALKYHPDRNPGDAQAEERFRRATEAYQILSDPQKREQFDKYGRVFDGNSGGYSDPSSFFEDIFGEAFSGFFGGSGRRSNPFSPRKGSNISVQQNISFEDAVFGTELKISIKKQIVCSSCLGNGAKQDGMQTCHTCGGSGVLTVRQGFFSMQTTCTACGGTGTTVKEKCNDCSGAGFHTENKTINIKIPAGIEDSMIIRIAGEGNDGTNGGPAGDLHVAISVKKHSIYKRNGRDLFIDVPITFTDAIIGKSMDIPALDGSAKKIEIKAGTQFGENIVFRHEGVPDVHGRGKGDLIVNIKIMLPTKLNDEQKELLAKFDSISTDDTYKNNKSLWKKMKDFFKEVSV